jgi:hypothetical protein
MRLTHAGATGGDAHGGEDLPDAKFFIVGVRIRRLPMGRRTHIVMGMLLRLRLPIFVLRESVTNLSLLFVSIYCWSWVKHHYCFVKLNVCTSSSVASSEKKIDTGGEEGDNRASMPES